jgi:Uncharacterized protein conserved in bacteria
MPDPSKVRSLPGVSLLGTMMHDPNLFHMNRHSVSVAFFVGLFIAFMPVLGQIPLAALGALLFRCNLPITVGLIWVSNPLTFPFIFFATYKLGARLLQIHPRPFEFQMSWDWFATEFLMIWEPLVLGCFMAGLFFGCLGFITIQWTWRWHVIQKWKQRSKRYKARTQK